MVLGFISLLLTFGQTYIAKICIPTHYGDTMLPCPSRSDHEAGGDHGSEMAAEAHHRRLLWYERRYLSAGGEPAECKAVSLLSTLPP